MRRGGGFLLLRADNRWHSAFVGITLQQFNEMNARVITAADEMLQSTTQLR